MFTAHPIKCMSMFTNRNIKAYCGLHRTVRAWHLLLVISFSAIAVVGSWLLRRTSVDIQESGEAYTTLVDGRLDCFFAGTSHFGYGIDPRWYSLSAMNITAGALNYQVMEIIIEQYLDRAPNLRLLVIEAGIMPLRVDTMARLDGDYRSLYRLGLTTFDLPLDPYEKIIQWLRESRLLYPIYFMDRWSPSLLVWGTRPLGGEGEGNVETRGFTPLDREITSDNDGSVVVGIQLLDHLRVDHSGRNLPALLRILDLAEARGVPVVLLRPPHHRTYVENRPQEWERQYQDMIHAVSARLDADHPKILDWEQHPAFHDEHFADGDHLNPRGVALLRELLNPLLLQMAGAGEKRERVSPEG